jgi:ATP-dependent protease HslVU (ClpYQ) peptidase subunit
MSAEEVATAAMTITADICIFTNHNLTIEVIGSAEEDAPEEASTKDGS